MRDLNEALLDYRSLRDSMNMKHRLGLITDDEWAEFMLKEDTLWNIINPPVLGESVGRVVCFARRYKMSGKKIST